MRYHFTLVKMAIFKKFINNKCWRGRGEKGMASRGLFHCPCWTGRIVPSGKRADAARSQGRAAAVGFPGPASVPNFSQQLVLTPREAIQPQSLISGASRCYLGISGAPSGVTNTIRGKNVLVWMEDGVRASGPRYVPHTPLYKLFHLVRAS